MKCAVTIRDARDEDGAQLIPMIGLIFVEYPHCFLDVDGEMPELRQIASTLAALDGRFWVAEREGQIVGCVGWAPAAAPNTSELKKLYVAAPTRRQGLASRLLEQVEAEARRQGSERVELWSDTKFHDAHHFYLRHGYEQPGAVRALDDISATREFYFVKQL